MRNILIGALAGAFVATPALAFEAHIVKMPTVGCFDRHVLQSANDLRDDDRPAERSALINDAMASGTCMALRPGLVVMVEDSDIVAGLTKVRAQGEPQPIWIRHGALSDE